MYIVGLITCKFWERMRSWQKWTSLLVELNAGENLIIMYKIIHFAVYTTMAISACMLVLYSCSW